MGGGGGLLQEKIRLARGRGGVVRGGVCVGGSGHGSGVVRQTWPPGDAARAQGGGGIMKPGSLASMGTVRFESKWRHFERALSMDCLQQNGPGRRRLRTRKAAWRGRASDCHLLVDERCWTPCPEQLKLGPMAALLPKTELLVAIWIACPWKKT